MFWTIQGLYNGVFPLETISFKRVQLIKIYPLVTDTLNPASFIKITAFQLYYTCNLLEGL